MDKLLSPLFVRVALLAFYFFGSQNKSFSQIAASPDTIFGMGTFNQVLCSMAQQADQSLIVGGDFTYFKTTKVNRMLSSTNKCNRMI